MTIILFITIYLPKLTLLFYLTLPITFKTYNKIYTTKTIIILITNYLHITFNTFTILTLILILKFITFFK